MTLTRYIMALTMPCSDHICIDLCQPIEKYRLHSTGTCMTFGCTITLYTYCLLENSIPEFVFGSKYYSNKFQQNHIFTLSIAQCCHLKLSVIKIEI